jgi:hypothetical protein
VGERADAHELRGVRVLRAALVAACALAGCRSFPPPPDHSDLDAEAARAFVRAQALAVKDLAAQVSLSVETGDDGGSLEGALLIEPPDRLRLRTTKMMQDVFDLVVTPQKLELWWFPDRVLYRRTPGPGAAAAADPRDLDGRKGDARASTILRALDPGTFRASLTAFELPPADASPRSPWQERVAGERCDRTRRAFVVVDELESGGRLTRTFDGASLLLRSAEVADAAGKTRIVATYDDYRPFGTLWLPTESKLVDRRFGVTFSMSFTDVALNEGVLPGAFELATPADAVVREIR